MERECGVDCAANSKVLPPHPPADMMNMFMTRYDYDYNRDGGHTDDERNSLKTENDKEAEWISGDVRNRPIEQYGQEWNGNTIYRQDYTAKSRFSNDALTTTDNTFTNANKKKNMMNDTAFTKFWFRAGLTPNATADGRHPSSVYKVDYSADKFKASLLPLTKSEGQLDTPLKDTCQLTLYAGARGVPYNADLLTVKGAQEDDGADIAPKITSESSLLPKHITLQCNDPRMESPSTIHERNTLLKTNLLPSRRSLLHSWSQPCSDDNNSSSNSNNNSNDDNNLINTCTSWDYGDRSRAHPLQLPQSIEGSIAESALTDHQFTNNPALLLRVLANKTPYQPHQQICHTSEFPSSLSNNILAITAAGNGESSLNKASANDHVFENNPIYIARNEQPKCAIRHRLEDEGFVSRTTYHTDYVNQRRLPELPGNLGGAGRVADTHTSAFNTAGEMTAGSTTRAMNEMAVLRNSHGTLKPIKTLVKSGALPQSAIGKEKNIQYDTMRTNENAIAVDKADPHRHKLRP